MLSIIVSTSVQLPLIAMSPALKSVFRLLLVHFLLLFAYGASAEYNPQPQAREIGEPLAYRQPILPIW